VSPRRGRESIPSACRASRSLRALMEFARNVLISATHFKCKLVFRFTFLRSDLFCHHMLINLSNLSVLQCCVFCCPAKRVSR